MKKNYLLLFILISFIKNVTHAQTWQPLGPDDFGQVSFSRADYPCITIDANGTVYTFFSDATNNGKARVRKFDGSNWKDLGTPDFSTDQIFTHLLKWMAMESLMFFTVILQMGSL